MKKIGYICLYTLLWPIAVLPMSVLYVLSDCTYFLMYYVVRYRVKVVRNNLQNAYPNKSEAERRQIERQFYHFLCDYIFETLHMPHMSEAEVSHHMSFDNVDLFDSVAAQNRNLIAVFGHFGNWELIASLPIHLKSMSVSTLYKTLHSSAMDKYFYNLRSHFGTHCYSRKQVLRGMVELRQMGKPFVMAFIADQTPNANNLDFWTNWLRQDTPFLTGWETIARKQNLPVAFFDIKRVARGRYVAHLEMLCDNPHDTQPGELVERYARRMEQTIDANPAYWLWSHKRWKHQRETSSNQ